MAAPARRPCESSWKGCLVWRPLRRSHKNPRYLRRSFSRVRAARLRLSPLSMEPVPWRQAVSLARGIRPRWRRPPSRRCGPGAAVPSQRRRPPVRRAPASRVVRPRDIVSQGRCPSSSQRSWPCCWERWLPSWRPSFWVPCCLAGSAAPIRPQASQSASRRSVQRRQADSPTTRRRSP